MSVLDTIKAATAARARVKICLDGALRAVHQDLQEQLVAASRKAIESESFSDGGAREIAEKMDQVSKQMAASEVTFTFERLVWSRRLALQAEHPPRKTTNPDGTEQDHPTDKALGFNMDTFAPALIRECCVEVVNASGSIAAGDDLTDELWETLFDKLNLAGVDELFGTAKSVNDLGATVPTSALALLKNQASDESSTPPEPGESAQNGSKAGNRRGSRKSSTTKKAASRGT
jgi:hypothetical protein